MKRFLLFAFDHYYPAGGLLDVAGSYDTLEEAIGAQVGVTDERYVLDRETWKIVHGKPPAAYNQKTNTYTPVLP